MLPDDVLDALRASRGKWAKVKHYESPAGGNSAANRIVEGKANGFVAGEWEACGRKNGDGSDLYVRFVGAES